MEIIIENVTEREIEILEKIDADWWPNDLLDDEAVILVHSKKELDDIMRAIGRK